MQKIKMSRGVTLTFEEVCKKYLENCRQRNLREGMSRTTVYTYIKVVQIKFGCVEFTHPFN